MIPLEKRLLAAAVVFVVAYLTASVSPWVVAMVAAFAYLQVTREDQS